MRCYNMKINRIKKLLVSVLVCSMAFGNISYIPTMAKENVQNYGLNNPQRTAAEY